MLTKEAGIHDSAVELQNVDAPNPKQFSQLRSVKKHIPIRSETGD